MNSNQKIINKGAEKVVICWLIENWNNKIEYDIRESDFNDRDYRKIFATLNKFNWNPDLTDWELEWTEVYDKRTDLRIESISYIQTWLVECVEELKKLSKRKEQLQIAENLKLKILDWWSEEEIMSIANQFYETETIKEQDSKSIREEIEWDAFHTWGDIKRFLVCYKDLDDMVWGFYPSQLITIAARPSIWKTALAINFIANQIQAWHKIAFFSLEMWKKEIYQRLYSRFARVEMWKIKWFIPMDKEEWERLTKAMDKIDELSDRLTVYDDKFWISEIVNQIRLLHNQWKADLIYIDYVWLIESKWENRNVQVSNITRELKKIAQKLKVSIVMLAQLNRWVENRVIDEPQLSDLRDSWAIEQDSNVVIMLQNEDEKCLKLLVKKNRDWRIGTVFVKKELRYMTIREFKPEELKFYLDNLT